MLFPHFVGMLVRDSRTSSANGALGRHEWQDNVRNEAAYRRVGMTVQAAQVDWVDRPASGAAHPQKPIASGGIRRTGRQFL